MDCCKKCLEPVEDEHGIMDLNDNDLCEYCAGKEEKSVIIFTDCLEMDFDNSLNH